LPSYILPARRLHHSDLANQKQRDSILSQTKILTIAFACILFCSSLASAQIRTVLTTIRLSSPTTPGVPTISGASNAELRMLTVEATENAVALFNNSAPSTDLQGEIQFHATRTFSVAVRSLRRFGCVRECFVEEMHSRC
jgi:hypothetical protein